jgi:hypothetical protein
MTKVWTAQHGWVYLHAIVDCCTRELVGWSVDLRCRDDEAIAVVEAAVVARRVQPGQLTLGSDNGSQGGFNRSSQHLDLGGVDGQADSVDESAYWTGADEVPRGAAASAGSGARVLG